MPKIPESLKNPGALVIAGLLIIAAAMSISGYFIHKDKTSSVEEVKVSYEALKSELETSQAEVIQLKTNNEILKKRCLNLTDTTERTKRTLIAYISGKYKRIPNLLVTAIAESIVTKCKEHNMPVSLINAIMEVESGYNPTVVSKAGARGLMQVMPKQWVTKLGLPDGYSLHQVDIGIDAGIRVFKIHLEEEDEDLSKALFKYVGGSSDYVTSVLNAIGEYTIYAANM